MYDIIHPFVSSVLVSIQILLSLGLMYFGTAIRKPFAVVFGAAVLMMAGGHFIDVQQAMGREADIIVSLTNNLVLGFSVLLLVGTGGNPAFNAAIAVAMLGGLYAVLNGIHGATEMYQLYDSVSSSLAVGAVGVVVAIRTSRWHPTLAVAVAVASAVFAYLNARYHQLEYLPHYHTVLGITTDVYAALIGGAYVTPHLRGAMRPDLNILSVYRTIQTCVGGSVHAMVSFLVPTSLRK